VLPILQTPPETSLSFSLFQGLGTIRATQHLPRRSPTERGSTFDTSPVLGRSLYKRSFVQTALCYFLFFFFRFPCPKPPSPYPATSPSLSKPPFRGARGAYMACTYARAREREGEALALKPFPLAPNPLQNASGASVAAFQG